MIHNTDFVLINSNGRYLHQNNESSTDKLLNARTYKTWKGAGRRCEGTDFKYIRVDEIEQPSDAPQVIPNQRINQ